VHDDVGRGDERVDGRGVGHVPAHERDPVRDAGERPLVAGVREGVEDGDVDVGALTERLVDEVGADEAGSTGDEQTHG
jgi:hypothetical protein